MLENVRSIWYFPIDQKFVKLQQFTKWRKWWPQQQHSRAETKRKLGVISFSGNSKGNFSVCGFGGETHWYCAFAHCQTCTKIRYFFSFHFITCYLKMNSLISVLRIINWLISSVLQRSLNTKKRKIKSPFISINRKNCVM